MHCLAGVSQNGQRPGTHAPRGAISRLLSCKLRGNALVPAVVLLAVLAANCPLVANDFLVGTADRDITPPIPYRMSGYFDERLSTGIKDHLRAKAIVFKQGDEQAALVFCDISGLPRSVTNAARHQASCGTGIPAGHIAIAATHSHTGPLIAGPLRDHFHRLALERLGDDPYEAFPYQTHLVQKIVAAVVEAQQNLQPATLKAGYAHEDRLSFNRRFHMQDGSVRFNPGELNPAIVRPAGPIDPQVAIISVERPGSNAPTAALVAFALHLDTTGGTEYSADYPRFVEERLRETFGDNLQLLFGIGTCGDVNHVDVSVRQRRPAGEIGGMLGETITHAMHQNKLSKVADPSLAVRTAAVDAPLQSYSNADLATARKNMNLLGSRELGFLEQVDAFRVMALEQYAVPTLSLEVHALRLGPETAIVMLPGEVFVELGLAIKAASPFETTMVIEMPDDALGYVPTKKGFAEGSYEIVNSRIVSGVGERLVETAIQLLNDLR